MKDRIKLVRNNAKLNQTDFAKSIGISRNSIAKAELGTLNLGLRTLKDICRIYKVNEDWLINGEGDMYKPLTKDQEIAAFLNDVMEDQPESIRKQWVYILSKLAMEDWILLDKIAKAYVAVTKKEDV